MKYKFTSAAESQVAYLQALTELRAERSAEGGEYKITGEMLDERVTRNVRHKLLMDALGIKGSK